ncbi:uncharacterized protein LAESUDRAFT_70731 [Laetiporus sulphureus 93-53]|uniref:Uncharacterized protein n=1 Tax=Laetiporus sulphureus 93-53 TaxID=1314785 RepID=A0A165AWW4_9APHY|nr:uncharacterized protein LAESUDRAFT_70731 [Laetiporus sulphureus 93-53]KZS99808.1 hypothetical protein LAESUDRAFT_70731 [Laetiporus sulphureus 93-53]
MRLARVGRCGEEVMKSRLAVAILIHWREFLGGYKVGTEHMGWRNKRIDKLGDSLVSIRASFWRRSHVLRPHLASLVVHRSPLVSPSSFDPSAINLCAHVRCLHRDLALYFAALPASFAPALPDLPYHVSEDFTRDIVGVVAAATRARFAGPIPGAQRQGFSLYLLEQRQALTLRLTTTPATRGIATCLCDDRCYSRLRSAPVHQDSSKPRKGPHSNLGEAHIGPAKSLYAPT